MTPKSIEITISPTGETKVETRGFNGGSCRDASRFIEQALGEKATEQMTAEFYEHSSARETQRLNG
jgi:hypothetical protein